MSSSLIQVLVTVAKTQTNLPAGAAPFASTQVVVTDSTGVAQAAVSLTGVESPPWSFTASVAAGAGSVTSTDVDTSGATIGTPVVQSFTEVGTPPVQFPASSGITVTPVTAPGAPSLTGVSRPTLT